MGSKGSLVAGGMGVPIGAQRSLGSAASSGPRYSTLMAASCGGSPAMAANALEGLSWGPRVAEEGELAELPAEESLLGMARAEDPPAT